MAQAAPAESIWRDKAGALGYGGALAYAAATHGAGIALMCYARQLHLGYSLLAVLLASHGRIVASYLIHEMAHGSAFKSLALNTRAGTLCLWLCAPGAARTALAPRWHRDDPNASACMPFAVPQEWLALLRLRARAQDPHRAPLRPRGYVRGALPAAVQRARLPLVTLAAPARHSLRAQFDYRVLLRKWALVKRAVLFLEWCFVPAVELIMHVHTSFSWLRSDLPLSRRANALVGSAVAVAFTRALYVAGGWQALALYTASGAVMLQVLALHDAFQHTYEVLVKAPGAEYVPGPGPRTAAYEETNTFSDLISLRWTWLNALVLNFGYHNAHHHKQMTPWYRLPALHAKIYGPQLEGCPVVLPMSTLAVNYVRHRVKRVLDSKEVFEAMSKLKGADRAAAFIGDLGVSFLTM